MTEFPETRASLLAHVRTAGDQEAWDEFVQIYRPVIYRMARRRGMQDADAQDVVQTVLIRVSKAIERWEQRERFRHWLRRVARNAIISALTRKPRDIATGGSVAHDLLNDQFEIAPEFQQELDNEYRREQYLRAAVIVQTDVSRETWRAFELSVIEGVPCDEVASQLGKSIGTVYASRSRVMRRLRDQIQELEGEQ